MWGRNVSGGRRGVGGRHQWRQGHRQSRSRAVPAALLFQDDEPQVPCRPWRSFDQAYFMFCLLSPDMMVQQVVPVWCRCYGTLLLGGLSVGPVVCCRLSALRRLRNRSGKIGLDRCGSVRSN